MILQGQLSPGSVLSNYKIDTACSMVVPELQSPMLLKSCGVDKGEVGIQV
jgi:hypothetical protein